MYPRIGIVVSQNLNENNFFLCRDYIQALMPFQVLPFCIPVTASIHHLHAYLNLCHGLLLTGGGDISPEYLKETDPEKKSLFNSIDAERDICEMYLIKQAVLEQIPLLGICRGCQILNVTMGGSLCPHINPRLHPIQQASRSVPIHHLYLKKHSFLRTLTEENFPMVNSFHHQAILQPGESLQITAWAFDGTIEAVEHETLPFCIGVQWHPEALKDDFSKNIFSKFAQAAHKFQKQHQKNFK